MRYPDIEHHGAKDGVTGSCHQLHMDASHSLLVDCGLFQGNETSSDGRAATERLDIEFSLATVQALVVTHVHIDHVGRIPYLLAAGCKDPIYCSEPSAKLLPIVLEDAFKLGFSRDQKAVERYLKLVEQRLCPLPYQRWSTLLETEELIARVRLQRAGHILGSAYEEVDLTYPASGENRRIVFSGDLGAAHAPLLMPPGSPKRADILVLESTYGDRLHEDRTNRRQRLEAVIEHALQDQGTVLIPAFSIGRTQELLYELEEIIHSKLQATTSHSVLHTDEHESKSVENTDNPHVQSPLPPGERARVRGNSDSSEYGLETNWPQLPIILDSPLATRFTEAYRSLSKPAALLESGSSRARRRRPQPAGIRQPDQDRQPHLPYRRGQPSDTDSTSRHRHRRHRYVHGWTHRQLPQSHAARSQARCSIRWLPSPGHTRSPHSAARPQRGLCRFGRRAFRYPCEGDKHGWLLGTCGSEGASGVRDGDAGGPREIRLVHGERRVKRELGIALGFSVHCLCDGNDA